MKKSLACRSEHGEDLRQAPLIERTNEIVRRINSAAGREILPEAQAAIPQSGRLPDVGGKAKMHRRRSSLAERNDGGLLLISPIGVPMTNAPSSMLKEAEIERMMTDTLTERLAAAEALGKVAGKDGLRSRNLNAAGSKRFRAIVKKAVRDVFGSMRPSGRMDPAAIRLLEPLSVIVARKRGELSERNMELLVEALLPANDPMSGVRSKIEADNAMARVRFAEEIPCLASSDLAEMAGHSARNRSATGSRWKAERKAFSVQLAGRELFPAFQFKDGKPDPAVAQVLDALPSGMSQWQVAFWFVSSNPWLEGGVPSENLDKVASVIEAARKLGEEAAG